MGQPKSARVPHKHAALIKAWADGVDIQSKDCGFGGSQWQDVENPNWFPNTEYRVKPTTIKYRNYLWQAPWDEALKHVGISYKEDTQNQNNFIRWLGDWQEVEV